MNRLHHHGHKDNKEHQNHKENKKSGNFKLWEIGNWDVKVIREFRNLLTSYGQVPSTKRLINSMIKFENMYQDITPNPFHFDLFSAIDDINSERRARRARIYLNKKDIIKTVDGKNGKRLILTSRGHKIFYEEYPLAKLREEKWDSDWTLITYDFPNTKRTERNYLRHKLTDFGFGCPQESLYVSPLPLSKPLHNLIEGEGYRQYVWVTVSKRVLGLSNREICQKAWNLDRLNGLYEKLLTVLPKIRKLGNKNLIDEWKNYFLALNNADPYLPRELLPEYWKGGICEKEFAKMGLPSLLNIIFNR